MKKHLPSFIPSVVAAGLAIGGLTANAQTPALQLKASNYNATTGVWTDSSGNGDTATFANGATPTLALGATPNGSAAVDIIGSNSSYGVGSNFGLLNPIAGGSGYTVLAYIEATGSTGARQALTGGSLSGGGGNLEYDVYGGNQDYLREYQADVAHGTATLPTASFSLIDLAVSAAGSSFNLNGLPDGTGTGASFTTPITEIGNNEGGGDYFNGYIAEIDIYSSVLTAGQISTQEAILNSEYAAPVPEPTTWVMLAGGLGTLIGMRRFRRS